MVTNGSVTRTIHHVRFHEFGPTTFEGLNEPLLDVIHETDPGELVINRQAYASFSPVRLSAVFTEDESLKEGRRGIHNPYFGYLGVKSRQDQPVELAVAVKPFRGEMVDEKGRAYSDCPRLNPPVDLTFEWAASEAISRFFGKDVTFKPVGIWRSEEGHIQLVTEFNRSVTTLDNIFHPHPDKAKSVTKDQIMRAVRIGMYELGALAALGYIHTDAVIRNIGRERSLLVWYPDNETMKSLQRDRFGAIADTVDNVQDVRKDLTQFFWSLVSAAKTPEIVARKTFAVLDDERTLRSLARSYNNAIAYGEKLSGAFVPEEFYMSTNELMGIMKRHMHKTRAFFGVDRTAKGLY